MDDNKLNQHDYNCEIIAEIANSHCGDFSSIQKLITHVSAAGCKNIKFQIFDPNQLVTKNHKDFLLFKSLCFSKDQWFEIANLCKRFKLKIYFDVFDLDSLELSLKLNPSGYKIHSTNIDDEYFIKKVSNNTNELIISTGGSYLTEVESAINWSISANKKIIIFLMSGIQNFPTSLSDTNLSKIFDLKDKFGSISNIRFGLQDHISGDDKMASIVPLIARAMNYNIIEKHITLDRSKKDNDYYSSLNPDEFSELINNWNKFGEIIGSQKYLSDTISDQEKKYRLFSKKYAVAKTELKKGTRLKQKHILFKRTGLGEEGMNRIAIKKYLDKKIIKNIDEDYVINRDCFES